MKIKEVDCKELREQAQLVRDMDTYLRDHVQDEEIFERWIMTVPDEIDDDDCILIADESESFHEVLRLFVEILLEDERS